MPEQSALKILRSTEELEAFAPAWRRLWCEDPDATPFQSPDWLLPWWHEFGQPDVHAIVLSRGETPVGFLPVLPLSRAGRPRTPPSADRDRHDGLSRRRILAALHRRRHRSRARFPSRANRAGLDTRHAAAPALAAACRRSAQPAAGALLFQSEGCSRTEAKRMAELPQKIRRNAMYYRNRALRTGDLELTVANEVDLAGSVRGAFASSRQSLAGPRPARRSRRRASRRHAPRSCSTPRSRRASFASAACV